MQSSIREIEKKHKDLLNLIQFPEDIFQSKNGFVQATPNSINTGVIGNGIRLPAQNVMFVDDNFMANTWKHLRLALTTSTEVLFILLGFPEESLRKSPSSINKYYESLCSYSRK